MRISQPTTDELSVEKLRLECAKLIAETGKINEESKLLNRKNRFAYFIALGAIALTLLANADKFIAVIKVFIS